MSSTCPRFLLLQIRNTGDPVRRQEVDSFAWALACDPKQISAWDLLSGGPDRRTLAKYDVVLIGGSGDYSVVNDEPWIGAALDVMQEICCESKPTFASCWGFQAMARALGGHVVHDLARAEIGTHTLRTTVAGGEDPLFGPLGAEFRGQMGHEDRVDRLPEGAVLLATSRQVENQAYRFDGKPIYCTQFHPELNRKALLNRLLQYPAYIERIAGVSTDQFVKMVEEAPETEGLLKRFVQLVLE